MPPARFLKQEYDRQEKTTASTRLYSRVVIGLTECFGSWATMPLPSSHLSSAESRNSKQTENLRDVQKIDSKVQHLFEAHSMEQVLQRAKTKQINLANGERNAECNVKRFMHWQNNTSSLAVTVRVGGKTRTLLITSNN